MMMTTVDAFLILGFSLVFVALGFSFERSVAIAVFANALIRIVDHFVVARSRWR